MPLVGIVGKKRDIQLIRKSLQEINIEMIQITKDSILNIKNIKFQYCFLMTQSNI